MLEIKLSNLHQHADIFYDSLLNTVGRVGKFRTGTELARDFRTVWEKGNPKIIATWLVKYFEDINSTTCLSYDDDEANTIISILKNPENQKSVIESVLSNWTDFKRYWKATMQEFQNQRSYQIQQFDEDDDVIGSAQQFQLDTTTSEDDFDEYDFSKERLNVKEFLNAPYQNPEKQTVLVESSDLLIGLSEDVRISSQDGIIAGIIESQSDYNMFQNDEDEEEQEIDWNTLHTDILEKYNEWLATVKIPGVVSMVAVKIVSPKSYNYSNDYVAIDIVVSPDIIKPSMVTAFNTYMRTNYKSYDGFFNQMPETIEEYNDMCVSDPDRAYSAAVSFLLQQHTSKTQREELKDNLYYLIDESSYLM